MNILRFFILMSLVLGSSTAFSQQHDEINQADVASGAIFDDKVLLDGYAEKYAGESQEILLAMIADEALGNYKTAAAIRVFKNNFAAQVLAREKPLIIKLLFRRLNRTDSPFVQVEIMHTLVVIDRYQYFESMVPILIQKMEHYNPVVSNAAYQSLQEIVKDAARAREARIVFNTLRKVLFLSRNKFKHIDTPDQKLRQKLDLLRWSVKVLGTQELKRLPSEVISLL